MNGSCCDEPAPVVVLIIVSPVEVEVAVGVDDREVGVTIRIDPRRMYLIPSMPLPLEYSWGCILFGILKSTSIRYQVTFIFRKFADDAGASLSRHHSAYCKFRISVARSIRPRASINLLSALILLLHFDFDKKRPRVS